MNSSANRRGSGEAWAEQYAEQISTIFTHTQNGKVKEEEKKLRLWDFAKRQLLLIKAVLADCGNESQLEEIQNSWSNLR